MNSSDVNLIRTAKRGNVEAFRVLVQNYKDFVFRTAFGLVRNKSDAEDVSQETFVKVHQSLKGLRDERTFPAWIARITVRTAVDWVDRAQRHPTVSLDPDSVAIASEFQDQSGLKLDLEQALGQLTYEQRTILVLREVDGFDYNELAQILAIPIGTVRSRLHHARAELRILLADERGKES